MQRKQGGLAGTLPSKDDQEMGKHTNLKQMQSEALEVDQNDENESSRENVSSARPKPAKKRRAATSTFKFR